MTESQGGLGVAQGFYASLELLPMYRGVDPDVDLFASGVVQDDAGEWEGGTALERGAAPSDAAGATAAWFTKVPACPTTGRPCHHTQPVRLRI